MTPFPNIDEALVEHAKLEGPQGDMARELLENRRAFEAELVRLEAEENWAELLPMVGSEARAPVLVKALRASSDDEARELLTHWFNILDAMHNEVDDLREQFERLGFVTDDENGTMPDLPLTVYRAQWGKDPTPVKALSWTARYDVAEQFAKYLTGGRAWFLGIKREDDEPWIWKGTVAEAYGWFVSRDEEEIVPKRMIGMAPIAKLVTVPKEDDDGEA